MSRIAASVSWEGIVTRDVQMAWRPFFVFDDCFGAVRDISGTERCCPPVTPCSSDSVLSTGDIVF